jgi:cytochrome d ubiquinol oxidase subunit I
VAFTGHPRREPHLRAITFGTDDDVSGWNNRPCSTVTTVYLAEALLVVAEGQQPPGLMPARQQMAVSLGWHIVLACFGVAFPTMIFVMRRRGIVRDGPVAMGLARRWAKVSAVLFAIGAVSGTILSFEMGLLWPGLMGRFGDVLGLPFAFEGLSFFVEAIFLGIYLYGWDRMPPRRHLLMLIPMGIAGVVGTFCVVSVNEVPPEP